MADEKTPYTEQVFDNIKSLNPPPRNVYPPKPAPMTPPPPTAPKDKK